MLHEFFTKYHSQIWPSEWEEGMSEFCGHYSWLVPTGSGPTYHTFVKLQFSALIELIIGVPMPIDVQKPRRGALLPVNTLREANVGHHAWWAALMHFVPQRLSVANSTIYNFFFHVMFD